MIKKLLLSLCSLGLVFGIALSNTAVAAATASRISLRLEPSEQTIDLAPGGHYTGNVAVYATSRSGLEFDVVVQPYQVFSDGDFSFDTEGDLTQLCNWITLPETHFSVEYQQAAVVNFEVDVPEDAVSSGQYAALMIRVSADDTTDDGIQIVPQVAALIYGHVDGADAVASGAIISRSFPGFVLDSSQFGASATFQNTGNIDLRIVESITVRDFFSNEEIINSNTINETGFPVGIVYNTVLPGVTKPVGLSWEEAPQLGIFRVTWTIDFLGEIETYEHLVIICPIWLLALIGAFIVLFILWIIARICERRRERPQVF